jgi:hypothetical protein
MEAAALYMFGRPLSDVIGPERCPTFRDFNHVVDMLVAFIRCQDQDL